MPRRARGGDRADTGLVELGRVDVVALVLFDKGRGSVVFGLGGGGRGVGLCGFVVEEREEKRRSGREEEEIRQGGKKRLPQCSLSFLFFFLTFFSAFFLAVSMDLSLRLNSLFAESVGEIRRGERDLEVREGKEKEIEHSNDRVLG